MKTVKLGLILFLMVSVTACRSRVVEVTLLNTSAFPITTIIVDYPGGTFGVNSLAPGKTYVYKLKPLQTGPLKIQFTDAAGTIHSSLWPSLHKDQAGTIEIRLSQDSANMTPH